MGKVRVTANADGHTIIRSSNPEYGYIRVEQERSFINPESNFVDSVTLSALVVGKIEILEGLGWVQDQEIPGIIYIKEQLYPFTSLDKDIKKSSRNGIPLKVGDAVIYRKCLYDSKGLKTDSLLEHTNKEEIINFNMSINEEKTGDTEKM